MLVRGVLIAVVVLTAAQSRSALAAPKRKVNIATEPAGATVYLASKEAGPVCTSTPCTFDAPVGDTPLIIELENHVSLVEILSVPARGRAPIKLAFELEAAIGKIIVAGPKGATITINEEDRGKAPAEIEMPAGAYIVVLTLNGKELESLPVEVLAGEDVTVEGGGGGQVAEAGGGGEDDAEKPIETATATTGPAPSRRGFIAVLALVDIVFRDFTYQEVTTANTLSPAFEIGNLIGPGVELYPGVLAGIRSLRGLSLFARYQINVGAQAVTGEGITGTTIPSWKSFEASVRQRFVFGSATVEASAGYVSDTYGYKTDTMSDVRLVPDVAYSAIRLGGRASLVLGKVEPFASGDYRIVSSGGPLEARFSDTATTGLRVAAGATAKLGPLEARVEGSLTLYRWAFAAIPDGEYQATGGSDSIKQLNLALRYAY